LGTGNLGEKSRALETGRILNRRNPMNFIKKNLVYVDGKCCNVMEVASKEEVLKIAYETIKSKPGNMTKGSNELTLDGISNS